MDCCIPRVDEAAFVRAVANAAEPVFAYLNGRGCAGCTSALGLMAAAAWCGTRARWVCLDAAQWPGLSRRYAVTDLPTILVLRGGRVVRRIVGHPLPDQLEMILRLEAGPAPRS
jgi:hypothetical protein